MIRALLLTYLALAVPTCGLLWACCVVGARYDHPTEEDGQ